MWKRTRRTNKRFRKLVREAAKEAGSHNEGAAGISDQYWLSTSYEHKLLSASDVCHLIRGPFNVCVPI